jgi:hypothetical protein
MAPRDPLVTLTVVRATVPDTYREPDHLAFARASKLCAESGSGLGSIANTAASFTSELPTIAKLVDSRRLAAIMALACGIATP